MPDTENAGGPGPPTPLPATIPAVLEVARDRFGGAEALVDARERLSFDDLAEAADEAARGFMASGVAPGDRIGIWAPNLTRWVVAALGAYRCGAVVVTLNTRYLGTEAAHILRTAGVRLLCTVTGFLEYDYLGMLGDAGPLPELREVVLLDGPADPRAPPGPSWSAGPARCGPTSRRHGRRPSAPAT